MILPLKREVINKLCFILLMLPLEIWGCISFYLENATEVGNLFTALNIPILLKLSFPVHIRNDMIACTITHNRKDIFTRIVSGNESIVDDLWDLLSCSLPKSRSPEEDEKSRKLVQCWSRRNGGRPWNDLTIRNAAMYCKTDVVKWLYNQHCPWEKDYMCLHAAWSDNLELLLWLREQGCPCTANEYRINRRYPKTHKIGDWMERHETMGAYLKTVNYFKVNGMNADLLDFAI
jgi:hypothetical protein